MKNVDEAIPYIIHFRDPNGVLLNRSKNKTPSVENRMRIDSKRMNRDWVSKALSENKDKFLFRSLKVRLYNIVSI